MNKLMIDTHLSYVAIFLTRQHLDQLILHGCIFFTHVEVNEEMSPLSFWWELEIFWKGLASLVLWICIAISIQQFCLKMYLIGFIECLKTPLSVVWCIAMLMNGVSHCYFDTTWCFGLWGTCWTQRSGPMFEHDFTDIISTAFKTCSSNLEC